MGRAFIVLLCLPGCSFLLTEPSGGGSDGGAVDSGRVDAQTDGGSPRNNKFDSEYSCDVDTLGLYHFSEGDPNDDICDIEGDTYDLSSIGISADGFFDHALEASDNDAVVPFDPTFGLPAFTIEAWVKPTSEVTSPMDVRYVVSSREAGVVRFEIFLVPGVGMNQFDVKAEVFGADDSGADCMQTADITGPTVDVGTWMHIALTIQDDGAVKRVELWAGPNEANNSLFGSVTVDGLCAPAAAAIGVGDQPIGTPQNPIGFGHLIDELRISKSVRFGEIR